MRELATRRRDTGIGYRPGTLFADVARSEFAKFTTVRASYLILAAALASVVGAAIALCEAHVQGMSAALRLTQLSFDPTSYSLSGVLLAQLAVVTLGALFITSEHASGLIRTTFSAVPQRRVVLASKAVILAVATCVVSEVAVFAAFLIGQAILSAHHAQASFADPGVLRAVVGAGLYLTVLVLLSLAVGVVVRHSAGAIAVLLGILLVLPAMAEGLPHRLQNAISPYLPSYAGQAVFHTTDDLHLLAPWTGFAVFSAYTAVALSIAFVVIGRRDT